MQSLLGTAASLVVVLLASSAGAQGPPIEVQTSGSGLVEDLGVNEGEAGVANAFGSRADYVGGGSWGAGDDRNRGIASVQGSALARRQVAIPGGGSFPIFASAWTASACDNAGYREAYANSPNDFNRNPFSPARSGALAMIAYDIAFPVAPTAPAAAFTTPIPVQFRIVWGVDIDGFAQAGVEAHLFDFGGSSDGLVFNVLLDEQGLAFNHRGLDPAMAQAFAQSGGILSSFPFGPGAWAQAVAYPGNSYRVSLRAEVGADATARFTNDWNNAGSAAAFIDPIFEIHPDYPYLDQVSVEYSEDFSVEADELVNPFPGTPLEALGDALIAAPEPAHALMSLASICALGALAWRVRLREPARR